MTGNYGLAAPPPAGDLPESIVKLHYTPPPAANAPGRLDAVAWFTPFHDSDRNPHGDDDFQDYDLGSAGPLAIPGMGLVVGAGKDGVLYVLDQDTARFGQGSNFAVLKQPPIFYTYFPGFGIDASVVHNLDHLYTGRHITCMPARCSGRARRMARCCFAGARTSTCERGKWTHQVK